MLSLLLRMRFWPSVAEAAHGRSKLWGIRMEQSSKVCLGFTPVFELVHTSPVDRCCVVDSRSTYF